MTTPTITLIARRVTAAALSLAVALGAALAPAPAAAEWHVQRGQAQQFPQGNNTAALIAGLVALGLIARAIDDDDDDDDDRRRATTVRRSSRIDIPAQCIRGNRHGPRLVAGACLRRLGIAHVRTLPDRCRRAAPHHIRGRFVYRVPCLRHAGYRFR